MGETAADRSAVVGRIGSLLMMVLVSAAVAAAQTPTSPCVVSTDASFARTPEHPARVGGGAMYVGARERRYLDALRGPSGQPIAYKRVGQMRAPNRPDNILDHYTVTYEGLEAPVSLYLDAYHYAEPQAPVGFTCVPFTLGPPPLDGFLASELLTKLAIEEAAGDIAPIPLDPAGTLTHGVAFDRFRLMARRARALADAGTPIDPGQPPRDFYTAGLTVIAYPLTCGDRTVKPTAIAVAPSKGRSAPVRRTVTSSDDVRTLVPGFEPPEGSIALELATAVFSPVDVVRITYDGETCGGAGSAVALPVAATRGKAIAMPLAALPAGAAPPDEPVWLQVVVDHEGRVREPTWIGGPESLAEAAMAAVKLWRAEPTRVNGAPVTIDTLLIVKFAARER